MLYVSNHLTLAARLIVEPCDSWTVPLLNFQTVRGKISDLKTLLNSLERQKALNKLSSLTIQLRSQRILYTGYVFDLNTFSNCVPKYSNDKMSL